MKIVAGFVRPLGFAVLLLGAFVSPHGADAAEIKVTVQDDPLEPIATLSTPHKLTWKSGAEAWLRGYVEKKTGELTIQIYVTTNAMDRTKGPLAINFLSADGPVQRVASDIPALWVSAQRGRHVFGSRSSDRFQLCRVDRYNVASMSHFPWAG
jgi:hypothetical protein